MARRSAGILVFRRTPGGTGGGAGGDAAVEVLLVHPGGPFWAGRDAGVWSIPKGEHGDDEDAEVAARREFAEELGLAVPAGELVALGEVRQKGGKVVTAWAVEGDLDADAVVSNTFELELPRGSGRLVPFPEVDRADWFAPGEARTRLLAAQQPFLDRLLAHLGGHDAHP